MSGISRRRLFRRGGALLALPAGLAGARLGEAALAPPSSPRLRLGPEIYRSIGVRPVINCRGTFTIVGGSLELPEVRAAKEAAAQHYVHMDELMEATGQRLATLTGAEWGIVTSGCAAALSHATAACVAGGNPDRHMRLPDLTGFPRTEVIIPRHSRNVYDAAIRAIGVKVVEVATLAELQSALGPRTAMVYVLSDDEVDAGELPLSVVAKAANARQVPVLVDAAAEVLTVPNVHLAAGAAMVGYSGGKCLRGPQCAGLLLGRKDLVRAAWVHSAPHHGYGRSMKVGKEEVIGMLMAVEMWMKRDHQAEWSRWVSWMQHISRRVTRIEGVAVTLREEKTRLSNRTPGLRIEWDPTRLGITGQELASILLSTEPRVVVHDEGNRRWRRRAGRSAAPGQTGIGITAYMMQPGDARVVASRIHAILSDPARARKSANLSTPPPGTPSASAPAANLSGRWQVEIEYIGSRSKHSFTLEQQDRQLRGEHRGDFVARDVWGSIDGKTVRLSSTYREGGSQLGYDFTGDVEGDRMSGTLDLGEYQTARWSARRA